MGSSLNFGRFRLDLDTDTLFGGEDRIAVGIRAAALLRALLEARGQVVTKAVLMDAAWPGLEVEESNITVQIAALRRALGDEWIVTVPRRGYRFAGQASVTGASDTTETNPTLAVVPVANHGDDNRERYFSDGVTREVITALSRFAGLTVIAANSSFRYGGGEPDIDQVRRELGVRYVTEINVRREGDRIRVSAGLIDAETRAHRWAEHYDRRVRDIFAVQDEVAERIAAVLVAHVSRAERERIAHKPVEALRAYDYYLRAVDLSRLWNKSDASAGEDMLQKAIEFDAGFAPAHALLAGYLVSSFLEPKDARWGDPATLERAWDASRLAVRNDPRLPAAHAASGWVLCWKHELDASVASYRRAEELNPSFADGHQGHVLGIAGLPEAGLRALLRAKLLDPFHPPQLLGWLGHCHLLLNQPEEALVVLRECTVSAPGWRPGHVWRAAACAQLRLDAEARAAAAEAMSIDPRFTVSGWQRMHGYRDTRRAATIARNLVQAGLPRG